ncbi:molybdopterin biosynthesis protein [Methanoregula sp. PtaB.Bin085]|uniref:molybdopterin biosynthesis protein n=1 Tax=Methanoregula sp. PtaB.Bin085 TaxID=1811680 RepID=UPI0009C423F3|nr:molybdopterin biosynthesis protein [Methanoregula sp. PtaB.Bin085]OPX62322.1 MAG: molybdopterin biosynthesis protein MoeA [Methanoregula sp. PtaB.Bin085]
MVNRYLTLLPLDEALTILTSSFERPSGTERISVTSAIGRVVAAPVHAKYSVPEVNLSAMDGIAVKSRDTIGASDTRPVTLTEFARVNTGNIIPPAFDAVIMIEDIWETDGKCQVRKSAVPWQHVRPAGEDMKENKLVLPRGHIIRAFDIGALATFGITSIEVLSVRIGIIPTGSELVPFGVRPGPGQVVESNTVMAQVFLSQMGADCTRYPIVPDDPDRIRETLRTAVRENDLVLISAGSSAGTRDFTESVIRSLGDLIFHGVAVKPGKPVMLGKIDGKPVLGLPGYPLAAQTVLREFAAPLLESWGFPPAPRLAVTVRLGQALVSDLGFDEFIPIFVGRIGQDLLGTPHGKGAFAQMSTVKANGYTHIPAPVEGYEAGTMLEVLLTTDPGSIERTLIFTGTLDPALEDLVNRAHDEGLFIHATNPGNIPGLLALGSNSCHAAPLVLPSRSLLTSYQPLTQFSGAGDLAFIHIASVELGIASINGLETKDLTRVRFINTRKETPSRTVLDALLAIEGIHPSQVNGYLQEVHGPPAVAVAIRNGFADAGICTSSIASANSLRFMPVAHEDYELVVRKEMLADSRFKTLVALIRSTGYRAALEKTGGYDLTLTGTIRGMNGSGTLTPFEPGCLPAGFI